MLDARSREPLACIDVGQEAHATLPSPDQSYIVVANQNGKLLQRIRTDYGANTYTLEPDATVDLARCRTPSGAACQDARLRPDNAPICPIIDSSGRLTFVTLRGGPYPPNRPPVKLVYSHDDRLYVDAHGGVLAKQGRYLRIRAAQCRRDYQPGRFRSGAAGSGGQRVRTLLRNGTWHAIGILRRSACRPEPVSIGARATAESTQVSDELQARAQSRMGTSGISGAAGAVARSTANRRSAGGDASPLPAGPRRQA